MKWVMASPSDIVVPNYYLGRYECDVMKISKAGHIYEYEIKVSLADFKRDAEKARTVYMMNHKVTKHDDIITGKRCSRFYFVVPEGLISKHEVPEGLGLIYASPAHLQGHLKFDIVKVSKQFKKAAVDISFYKHVSQNLTLKLIAAKNRLVMHKKVYNGK